MDVLFLTYANSQTRLLPTLQAEDDGVYRALSPRALRQHFLLHRDSFTSLAKVAEYLTLYRDRISLFHYSGHAGRDALLLDDEKTHAGGIAHLLGQCSQLQVVVLNGCSTRGQVAALLDAGVPVVIATSAPLDDEKASRFGIRFYGALAAHASIREAFEQAVGEVMALDPDIGERVERGLLLREQAAGKPAWGLYWREGCEAVTERRLPAETRYPVPADYEPNAHLINGLWEGLAPYSETIQDTAKRRLVSPSRKRQAIVNSLPAPVAEHIRRLVVPVENENEGWDKISAARLQQAALAYQTAMELLTFTLLAQLWEIALAHKEPLRLPETRRREILDFLQMNRSEQQTYDYLAFIRHLREQIDAHGGAYFMEELGRAKDLLYREGPFQDACFFLEVLRVKVYRQSVDPGELNELCIRAEESLTTVLAALGFMARYALVAIQNINVLKYRHDPQVHFEHLAVILRDVLGKMDVTPLEMDDFMDNRSIVLFNEETGDHLALSPFIIDLNSFKNRTNVVSIYFISHYEPANDTYHFKWINRPEEDARRIRVTNNDFHLVKVQLEAFQQLLNPAP